MSEPNKTRTACGALAGFSGTLAAYCAYRIVIEQSTAWQVGWLFAGVITCVLAVAFFDRAR